MIIARKKIGVVNDADKELHVSHVHIDGGSESIVFTYGIVLVSKAGAVLSTLESNAFRIFNRPQEGERPANNLFDEVMKGFSGKGLLEFINHMLAKYDGTAQSLEQQ